MFFSWSHTLTILTEFLANSLISLSQFKVCNLLMLLSVQCDFMKMQ